MLISSLYNRPGTKTSVNTRRINKERRRVKLSKAQFIPYPRLVLDSTTRLVAITK